MLVFQLVAIPLTLALFLWSAVRWARGERPRGLALSRTLLWLAAAVAVWRPDWTTKLARLVGIGRGADLVLYAVALAFVGVAFALYRRTRQLEADVTRLVRHVALMTAEEGSEEAVGDTEDAADDDA